MEVYCVVCSCSDCRKKLHKSREMIDADEFEDANEAQDLSQRPASPAVREDASPDDMEVDGERYFRDLLEDICKSAGENADCEDEDEEEDEEVHLNHQNETFSPNIITCSSSNNNYFISRSDSTDSNVSSAGISGLTLASSPVASKSIIWTYVTRVLKDGESKYNCIHLYVLLFD